MIGYLQDGWELLTWFEVQELGLKPAAPTEDAGVFVRNIKTGEVLAYPDYYKKHEAK